jgi:hypothetical protein
MVKHRQASVRRAHSRPVLEEPKRRRSSVVRAKCRVRVRWAREVRSRMAAGQGSSVSRQRRAVTQMSKYKSRKGERRPLPAALKDAKTHAQPSSPGQLR